MKRLFIVLVLAGFWPIDLMVDLSPFREIQNSLGVVSKEQVRKQKACDAKKKIEQEKQDNKGN